MDKHSENTLRRIEQNLNYAAEVLIGSYYEYYDDDVHNKFDGSFNSSCREDFSRLGAAIGNNTHLTELGVDDLYESVLTVTNRKFFDGLKQNTSIHKLHLCSRNRIINIVGGVFHEILKAYQENNNHLTFIYIVGASLQNGGVDIIANTLRRCTNLKHISLYENDMTDAQLLPLVDAIRGHNKLEELDLDGNNIGDVGCETLATLLEDPNCNVRTLGLAGNQIGDAGATAIANSLSGNNKLQKLYLQGNSLINRIVDIFCGVLCNTSSINSTYSSNHTLNVLTLNVLNDLDFESIKQQLVSLLKMNEDTNKSHVAMKKILKYHSNIDMEPLFEWDTEEGEQNLKALPYVIDWFDAANTLAVAVNAEVDDESDGDSSADSDHEEESYNIDGKKLSAIYQFAMAMPTLFVPASHNEGGNKNSKKKQKLL